MVLGFGCSGSYLEVLGLDTRVLAEESGFWCSESCLEVLGVVEWGSCLKVLGLGWSGSFVEILDLVAGDLA